MSSSTHALIIDPESELKFNLSHSEATLRCIMTLSHPGTTDEHLAFKVKTTQPRRYLVRPNQGMIAPNGSEQISILLVEKDKQVLLQSYERLGQSGLDHSKDKFLVQSCTVSPEFTAKMSKGDSNELYEALTSMWNTVTSGGSTTPIYNKKLHVRHVVQADGGANSKARGGALAGGKTPALKPHEVNANMEDMTKDQLVSELSNLRRKYDELVSFSVNLTAERDILSNTLEQAKRDYNREMAARSALESKHGSGKAGGGVGGGSVQALIVQLLVVGLACLLAGIRMGSSGQAAFLKGVPVLGMAFADSDEGSVTSTADPDVPISE